MKYIRLLLFALFLIPAGGAVAATAIPNNEFMIAAQLLAAAKNADIQQVQNLINAGANVNYVDSTGLSLVCTALMNNDVRAAQILQMYGADASQCDRQIKQYESRTQPTESGGLFSGLSSAQTISLAAAGAAVVVGGLFLLTDWLDPGNENGGGTSGGGNRPGQGEGGGGSGGTTTSTAAIPVGPAYFTSTGDIAYSTAAYQNNLTQWNPSVGGIRAADFNYFRPGVKAEPDDDDNEDVPQIQQTSYLTDGITVPLQNYLLMMHGYSSFANGYMGQMTLRDATSHDPQKISNLTGGGKPIRTALITANGVNPAGSIGRTTDGILWGATSAQETASGKMDKFANYNNPTTVLGTELSGLGGSDVFDWSGSGTAMNPFATATESALGKIVAGWEQSNRAYGDLYGFAPNSQLAVYRTGNGTGWVDVENPTDSATVGSLTDLAAAGTAGKIDVGDTIVLNGKTYTISSALEDADSVTNPTITVGDTTYKIGNGSNLLKGTCTAGCDDADDNKDEVIALYMGLDGNYYVNTSGGNRPDAVYMISEGQIYTAKKWDENQDIKTFEVIANMSKYYQLLQSDTTNGLSSIAVTTLNPESRKLSYVNTGGVESAIALNNNNAAQTFMALINQYYDKDDSGATSQGSYANSVLQNYVSTQMPILIMPAGEFEYGLGDGKTYTVQEATFESYAPLIYNNLNHLFMTVVAVQHSVGTSNADSIEDYGNGIGDEFGRLYLSAWTDTKGTETKDDDVTYMSRKCGIAGLGLNGVDPWCFSAAGPTAEIATASAAGAVAALKGAFAYMNSGEIFTLMALTADGPYLGTDSAGNAFTVDGLVTYLKSMYALPPDYHEDELLGQDYLDAFAEVYGYGLINLERAMTPGNKIYFYDGNKIVSGNGNAYWRAASNTVFRASSAFGGRSATISAPFFDVLESVNGDMSMPRVWKNEFALGVTDARGLYMGDVLGEFKARNADAPRVQVGNFGFSMAVSEKQYVDNLNGLDNLRLDYTSGDWNFAAEYQRHFTDGASRFDGMSNPILGLASNAITTDAWYNMGRWSFGARAFSGAITDETMLDNDPTISSQYVPARLGLMQGAQSSVAWNSDAFGFTASVGAAFESDTLLGALSGGLLDMGSGDTVYVDSEFRFSPADDVTFKLRSTFARTTSDAAGQFILGLTDIDSNAFAFGVDAGNFSFSVSQPLTVANGAVMYPYAEYTVVDNGDGKYDLNISNTHIENMSLRPDVREVRFTGAYRHNFGEFTDGAIGFIYRVHPNNTDEFGNESIFMMKMTHRLGI